MKNNKVFDFIGTILIAAGLLFAFLPHAFHTSIGFENETHSIHIIYGIVLLLVGLGILIVNNKALKFLK